MHPDLCPMSDVSGFAVAYLQEPCARRAARARVISTGGARAQARGAMILPCTTWPSASTCSPNAYFSIAPYDAQQKTCVCVASEA